MNDRDSLSKALKGSYAVYAVTNYWEKMDAKMEEEQGRTIADLAKQHGVQHYIWSTLNDISKTSNGLLNEVHHFDAKARVDDYIKSIGLPTTYYLPGLYMSNFLGQEIRKNSDGLYQLGLPIATDTTMAMLATEFDTGKFIKSILLQSEKTIGKRIFGAEKYYSVNELMEIFAKVKPVDGKGAKAITVSDEDYKAGLASMGMPPFVQEELVQNYRLNDTKAGGPGYYNGEDLMESQNILDEQLVSWEDYLRQSLQLKDLK